MVVDGMVLQQVLVQVGKADLVSLSSHIHLNINLDFHRPIPYNKQVFNGHSMEIFTIEEWEEKFDELYKRVENGETIGIVKEDGTAAVMMPYDDELLRIHTDHDDAS